MAGWRDPRRSSTWSMSCCSSRATAVRTGSCAPTRIGSARPRRSACSRCAGRGRAIDAKTVMFGEVGVAGEIRAVPLCEQRLAEAARLGFTRALIPKQNAGRLEQRHGMELVAVDRLTTAIAEL